MPEPVETGERFVEHRAVAEVVLVVREDFVLHRAVFGNPNSFGAVMGVVTMPVLLWGVLISEGTSVNRRKAFALVLCILLLLTSHARAAILAASVSAPLLCVAMRRYRLLLKGVGVALVGAMVVAALMG